MKKITSRDTLEFVLGIYALAETVEASTASDLARLSWTLHTCLEQAVKNYAEDLEIKI